MMQKYLGSFIENKKVDGDCGKAESVHKWLIIYLKRAYSKTFIYAKVQNFLSTPSMKTFNERVLWNTLYTYIFFTFIYDRLFIYFINYYLSLYFRLFCKITFLSSIWHYYIDWSSGFDKNSHFPIIFYSQLTYLIGKCL